MDFKQGFFLAILYVSGTPLFVFIHELAHALAALLTGHRLIEFSIGKGSEVWGKRIGGLRIHLGSEPFSGYVIAYLPRCRFYRTSTFLFIAAGPLSTLLLIGLFWHLIDDHPFKEIETFLNEACFMMMIANGMILYNVFGLREDRNKNIVFDGDIPKLFRLPWYSGEKVRRQQALQLAVSVQYEAQHYTESIFGKEVPGVTTPGRGRLYWNRTVQNCPVEVFVDAHHEIIEYHRKYLKLEASHWDLLATGLLFYGDDRFRDEAANAANRVMEFDAKDWSHIGTKGSSLVVQGHWKEGREMLLSAYDRSPENFGRSIDAAFIALSYYRENNVNAARDWLKKSREAEDGNCPIEWVERLILEIDPGGVFRTDPQGY